MATFDQDTTRSLHQMDLRCPPLPQTLLEAMELTHKPDGPELEQVVDMVQHDPVVVARILRIVNSPYYGQRGQITNVHRAVLVMGPVSVLGVVMSMSLIEVRAALDEKTTTPFLNLVRHSIATAFLAQVLLERDPALPDNGPGRRERISEAFTAGIMHDFGKLLFLYNYPEEAAEFYTTPPGTTAGEQMDAERALFENDHQETGHYLAQRLKFPDNLATVMAGHHSPPQRLAEGEHAPLLHIVAASNLAANALGFALNHEVSWEACAADPIWQRMVDQRLVGYASGRDMLDVIEGARPALTDYVDAIF